jgi:3D (Asp-Asp-Asp) domain-containing protein
LWAAQIIKRGDRVKKLFYVLLILWIVALAIIPFQDAHAAELLAGSFTITTYADTPEDQENYVGQTATGADPVIGVTCAVDPEVIPLGSWLFIEGIGFRRAEDTGGLIKGNIIDLLVGTSGETYKERLVWIVRA